MKKIRVGLLLVLMAASLAGCPAGTPAGLPTDLPTGTPPPPETHYTVSGVVRTAAGAGMPGVTIAFGSGYASVTTGADGSWSRDGLAGSVTATPALAGNAFYPADSTVSDVSSGVDFIGGTARTLTVQAQATTVGTSGPITRTPDLLLYPSGLSVILSAANGDADTFMEGWSTTHVTAVPGLQANPVTITVDSDQTWYAIFSHTEITLNWLDDDLDGIIDEGSY